MPLERLGEQAHRRLPKQKPISRQAPVRLDAELLGGRFLRRVGTVQRQVIGDAHVDCLDQEQVGFTLYRWHQAAAGNPLAEHFRIDVDEVDRRLLGVFFGAEESTGVFLASCRFVEDAAVDPGCQDFADR